MEELLRQILAELQNQDSTPWWLEVLRTIGPLVGGALVAAIGFFAVHKQNETQRENMKLTMEAEADAQRRARLTDWRRERYKELLDAFGEFYGAVRSMILVAATAVDEDEVKAAVRSYIVVSDSGRILQASSQVADRRAAELSEQLADQYHAASEQLLTSDYSLKAGDDLEQAYLAIKKEIDESAELRYELNRRIEQLISEGA